MGKLGKEVGGQAGAPSPGISPFLPAGGRIRTAWVSRDAGRISVVFDCR